MTTEIVPLVLGSRDARLCRSAGADPANEVGAGGPGRADSKRCEPDRRWSIEVDVDLRGELLDPEYWVRHCEGFLVDSESGERVGVVDRVELAPDTKRPVALVVVSGWFGRRVTKVDVADLAAILPGERRLTVKDAAPRPARRTRASV